MNGRQKSPEPVESRNTRKTNVAAANPISTDVIRGSVLEALNVPELALREVTIAGESGRAEFFTRERPARFGSRSAARG